MQALTACSLASFSLVDCMQSVVGATLEVLPPSFLAALNGLAASAAVPGALSFRPVSLTCHQPT